jgi:hypothetical protein
LSRRACRDEQDPSPHCFEATMNKQDSAKIVEAFWDAVWQGKVKAPA